MNKPCELADGQLVLRPLNYDTELNGQPGPELSIAEFEIAYALAKRPFEIHGLDELGDLASRTHKPLRPDNITTIMGNLRKKVGEPYNDHETGIFRTVRQHGYYAAASLELPLSSATLDRYLQRKMTFYSGRIAVYPQLRAVSVDGYVQPSFTAREYDVIALLALRRGAYQNAYTIAHKLFGDRGSTSIEHVAVLVSNIRQKLGAEPGDVKSGALRTSKDLGYLARR